MEYEWLLEKDLGVIFGKSVLKSSITFELFSLYSFSYDKEGGQF